MRTWFTALAIASLLAVASTAFAARRDFVGSATCGTCHPQVLADWKATAHARATAALGARPPARCMACHGTGDAPAGRAYFAEVGCEACHGAGAHYATDDLMRDRPLALALGLVDLSVPTTRTAVCARCHTSSTRLRPVDLRAPVHPTR
ncbi:MAG TPA: multiheme c-type cytochrome [Kofleriaceae bacterium]|nr:multiheme c-type cytochrome [Kofleriaceae bacterium]